MNSVWGLLWVAVFVLTSLAAQAEQHSIACEPNDADCLLDEARSVATELTRTLERDEAYLAISSALARLGHLEQARNEANNISNAIMASSSTTSIFFLYSILHSICIEYFVEFQHKFSMAFSV